MVESIKKEIEFYKERGLNLISERPRFSSEKVSYWASLISGSIAEATPHFILSMWNLIVKNYPNLSSKEDFFKKEAREYEAEFRQEASKWEAAVNNAFYYSTFLLEDAWISFINNVQYLIEDLVE